MELLLGKRAKSELRPPDAVARYVCSKISWRGRYRRVLAITTSELLTANPEIGMVVTNRYSFVNLEGGPDLDAVSIGSTVSDDEAEFTLSCRSDAKSKYKPIKFVCKAKQRGQLLTDLFQCIARAQALGKCVAAFKLLGSMDSFPALRRVNDTWTPITLRLLAYGMEVVDETGSISWRAAFSEMSSPALSSLSASTTNTATAGVVPPDGQFMVSLTTQRLPEVFASRQRDSLMQSIAAMSLRKLGILLGVNTSGKVTAAAVLEAIMWSERVAASQPVEAPLGEWEVGRLLLRYDVLPALLIQLDPTTQARGFAPLAAMEAAQLLGLSPGANIVPRRLLVTATHLLERNTDTYEVTERRPLSSIAAIIRFLHEPKLMGVEWCDGQQPSLYVTTGREAALALLLDAAQLAAMRPIPVLPGYSCPGDAIVVCPYASHACAIRRDAEVERWCLEKLNARAKECFPTINGSGRMFFTADIEFSSIVQPSLLNPYINTGGAGGSAVMLPDARVSIGGSAASGGNSGVSSPRLMSSNPAPLSAAALTAAAAAAAGYSTSHAQVTPLQEAVDLMLEAVYELNACVAYAGITPGSRVDEQTLSCVLALLPPALQPNTAVSHLPEEEAKEAIAVLQCLQRLAGSADVAEAMLSAPAAIGRIFAAYACAVDAVTLEAARLLTRLWAPAAARCGAGPWRMSRRQLFALSASPSLPDASDLDSADSSPDDLMLSKTAKALCFGNSILRDRCRLLLSPIRRDPPASALSVMAAVEALGAVVVEPGSRTTDTRLLNTLLQECAGVGRPMFALFAHGSPRVSEGAAFIMRAVAEAGAVSAAPMKEAALREGAVLHHLYNAIFASGTKARLSQELVASWTDEYAQALALLRRIFPAGLLRFLNTPRTAAQQQVLQQQQLAKQQALVQQALDDLSMQSPAQLAQSAAQEQPHRSYQQSLTDSKARSQAGSPLASSPVPTSHMAAAAGRITPLVAVADVSQPGAVPTPSSPQHGTAQPSSSAGVASAGAHTSSGSSSQVHVDSGVSDGAASGTAQASIASLPNGQPPQAQPAHHLQQASMSSGLKGNWDAFWAAVLKDHCHAGLIWNASTRSELKEALDKEETGLRSRRQQVGQGSSGYPSWNAAEFSVSYPSLNRHLCIANIYVRLLLDGGDTSAVERVPAPKDLFNALFQKFLCQCDPVTTDVVAPSSSAVSRNMANDGSMHSLPGLSGSSHGVAAGNSSTAADGRDVQQQCIKAMALVYSHHAGTIGAFDGVSHLVRVLDLTTDSVLRLQLLLLMQALIMPATEAKSAQASRAARANSYAFIDAGGVELCSDLLTLAHGSSDHSRWLALGDGGGGGGSGTGAAPMLLTEGGHKEAVKAWFYYPQGYHPEGIGAGGTANSAVPGSASLSSTGASSLADGISSPTATANGGSSICSVSATDEVGRAGPLSRDELLYMVMHGKVSKDVLVWADGMQRPMALRDIRELRWLTADRPALFSPLEVARHSLRLLLQLVRLQPAVDDLGQVLQPLPRVHRLLAEPHCLPHIAQVMLTGDPQLVALSATLLEEALAHHHDAAARLYLTGVFYFALAYLGNNWVELARLMLRTHLRQAFRGAVAPAGLPLEARSYLGHALPPSLLYVLETQGAEAFAEALTGDHDTPELIWTHAMRSQRLVPQILIHLGDFPSRLAQHGHAVYEYAPLPPLSYAELQPEIYCHRYYLRNLCDAGRFPNWVITDHVQMLQSLLAEWRAELSRQPLAMSEADACRTLGLTPGDDGSIPEEQLRRAYRGLARKHHPDKNPDPASRAIFLSVQRAHERLQAGVAGGQGPQPWRILLMLRAQVVLYRRYARVLQPFKYAGYVQLVDGINQQQQQQPPQQSQSQTQMQQQPQQQNIAPSTGAAAVAVHDAVPPNPNSPMAASSSTTGTAGAHSSIVSSSGSSFGHGGSFLSPEGVEQVQAAVELCWLTCASSRLNAEELSRSGGVAVLGQLLSRCVGILQVDTPPTAPAAVIVTGLLRTSAGLAAVEAARAQLVTAPALISDIIKCCELLHAPAAVDAALVAIAHLSASTTLQNLLLELGVLPRLVPLLLQYDATLAPEVQASMLLPFPPPTASIAAAASVSAAAAGSLEEPFRVLDTPLVRSSVPLARSQHALLAAQALSRLAGVLPPPYASPPCGVACKALAALLTPPLAGLLPESDPRNLVTMLADNVESPQVIWNGSMRNELQAMLALQRATPDLKKLMAFRFKSLQGELQVAGLYVRLFLKQPTVMPAEPQAFCKGLVRWLYEQLVDGPAASDALPDGSPRQDVLSALRALSALLDGEPRLMGLLASQSALLPLLACLHAASGTAARQVATPGVPIAPSVEADISVASAAAPLQAPAVSTMAVAAASNAMAIAGLQLLQKLTQHGGCGDVLAQEASVRTLFLLLHSPPSLDCLSRALQLLRALAQHHVVGTVAAMQGCFLYVLMVLLHLGPWPWSTSSVTQDSRAAEDEVRGSAAVLLSRLMTLPTSGPMIIMMLQKLLPPGLVTAIQEGPPEATLAALSNAVETPEMLWHPDMATAAATEVSSLAHALRQRHTTGAWDYALPAGYSLRYNRLEGELHVGGVYVRTFLKNPQYPLRNPKRFAEGLMERYLSEVTARGQPVSSSGNSNDTTVLLSAVAVALLKSHSLLADHLASLGYVPRLLALLPLGATSTATASAAGGAPLGGDVAGSALRLLHQLCISSNASEALATCTAPPAVRSLLLALQWGPGAQVLVLECLKRSLSRSNRQRDALLSQALHAGLVPLLLAMLDWRSTAADETSDGLGGGGVSADAAVQRALAVDVLHLLLVEGAYSAQMSQLLEASEVWRAYRDQRHDMFLPSNSSVEGSVVGLLQGDEAMRYALPAADLSTSS